jgi:hypothetical protein
MNQAKERMNSRIVKILPLAMMSATLTLPLGAHAQELAPPVAARPYIPLAASLGVHEPAQRFGVSTHLARLGRGWTPDMLPMIRALGVSSFRDEETWNSIERQKGVYKVDPVMEEAVNRGQTLNLENLFLLGFGNPVYANKVDPEAFTRYALWMIDHFKGRIKYFELWSEPELHDFVDTFGGTWNGKEADNSDSPWVKKFAEFATIVGKEIKRKHPEIKLVGYSSNAPSNQRHFKYPEMWKYIDVLAIHPYPYRLPPETVPWGGKEIDARDGVKTADEDQSFASHIRLYREGLKKVGRPDMPIWITEVGYTSAQLKQTGLWQGFTEPAQAIYLVRMALLAAGNGVERTYFYDFYDDGDNRHEVEDNFGLVRRDYTLKPSYHAVQRMCALMPGDTKVTPLPLKVERLGAWPRQDGTKWDGQAIQYLDQPQAHSFVRPDGQRVLFLWQPGRIYADAHEELANLTLTLPGVAVQEVGRVVSGETINPKTSRMGDTLTISELPYGADPVYILLK